MEAQTVSLTNGAQIQSGTAGAGRGGNVTVMARDAVTVDGFGGGLLSLITASSLATGNRRRGQRAGGGANGDGHQWGPDQ